MDKYFQKFPNIYYANTLCKDITRRVKINEFANTQGTMDIFYPYQVINHSRPDHIASEYYKDPEQDWLIYLANEIIDPYYQWYLDQNSFEELVKEKHTSAEIATRKIMYWTCNWAEDDNSLSPSYYENNLDTRWRKYYEPSWGTNSRIVSYVRKKQDLYMNTNKIVQYTATYSSNSIFTVGEPVDFINDTSTVGMGQVVFANTTVVIVQHTQDDITANSSVTKTIVGMESEVEATSNSMSVIVQNIDDEELVFWTPVTVYDMMNEQNEQRKDIYLVATGGNSLISQKVTEKLRENVNPITNLVVE